MRGSTSKITKLKSRFEPLARRKKGVVPQGETKKTTPEGRTPEKRNSGGHISTIGKRKTEKASRRRQ